MKPESNLINTPVYFITRKSEYFTTNGNIYSCKSPSMVKGDKVDIDKEIEKLETDTAYEALEYA